MNASAIRLAALLFSAFATPALAHPGHLAQQAGHTHWPALAALGVALAIGVTAALRLTRGRRRARAHE